MRRITLQLGGAGVFLLGSVGCQDLVGGAALPPGVQSPNTYNSATGAMSMYLGGKQALNLVVQHGINVASLLTDELVSADLGSGPASVGATGDLLDERILTETQSQRDGLYSGLQAVRGTALQAIGLLRTYAPTFSPALRGEMQVVEGYAEVLLADFYCAGVPLSTLDFQKDFTYKPSSTTAEVYQHAIALFDSALTISSDSPSVQWFAQVEKGRALQALGQYMLAAQAVAAVPDTFRYQVSVLAIDGSTFSRATIADREGINGLPFSSSGDPRIEVIAMGNNRFGVPIFWPAKYPVNTSVPVVLASGIEARLIQAEAALQAGDPSTWLTILNTLRTSCVTSEDCPTPEPAGTGGIPGLPLLVDPGSDTARVTLLFAERAYWLFLTLQRQSDLRRLVRNYGRPQETVYPIGPYFGGLGAYGDDVARPIPPSERANPLFHGCLDREA